jgi:phage terminase large subunit-like protein
MKRVIVAIDPSATKSDEADEVGMFVAGLGENDHCYIFEDLSGSLSPHQTCVKAVNAYSLWDADRIVAEANNGGDWIEMGLRQVKSDISYKKLHASRGKQARAEPVAALYEQKRVHHVGTFGQAEDELCTWEPNTGMASPNRLDAIVWAVTELMLQGSGIATLHVRI